VELKVIKDIVEVWLAQTNMQRLWLLWKMS